MYLPAAQVAGAPPHLDAAILQYLMYEDFYSYWSIVARLFGRHPALTGECAASEEEYRRPVHTTPLHLDLDPVVQEELRSRFFAEVVSCQDGLFDSFSQGREGGEYGCSRFKFRRSFFL